jgi:hypothetical protein
MIIFGVIGGVDYDQEGQQERKKKQESGTDESLLFL